jgi:hypothetical protein
MNKRNATDAIKGYFYQFDYSIEQLLNLHDLDSEVTIEGIEDIDIESSSNFTAIQCKYYSKTEYNHSIIAKPIRLMLEHFSKVKKGHTEPLKYHLYGHYKSGQKKLIQPIDVTYLKDKFLTYKESKIQVKHHENLNLTDKDLEGFIELLSININAESYSNQYSNIISSLASQFSCDDFDAEYFFYNNALNEIRKIAIEGDVKNRKITKKEFLNRINNKQVLQNKWFSQLKGEHKYHKELKSQYFTKLNKEPYERFFLIELPSNYSIVDLKNIVMLISNKYSNLKQRETQTYCPYIYFHNINTTDLIELKSQLYNEGFNFIDGFPFLGCTFSNKSISVKADYYNKIKVKILNENNQINLLITHLEKTKEIYQFYLNKPFLVLETNNILHVSIPVSNFNNIKEII